MKTITEITETKGWDDVLTQSHEQPVYIFKHSTACPVSADALKEFKQFVNQYDPEEKEGQHGGKLTFNLVKVIESREVSNNIAEVTQVKHESPQALLIHNGQVKWHASHWHITNKSLQQAVETL